jgi:hypothetical protein
MDGDQPSFSRVATGIIMVACITWVSTLVFTKGTLPDLGGLTLFLVALYGANMAKTAATNIGIGKEEGK